jgi:hypothetical protein
MEWGLCPPDARPERVGRPLCCVQQFGYLRVNRPSIYRVISGKTRPKRVGAVDTDRLRQLAHDLRDALAEADDASARLQSSISSARVALAEMDGILGSTSQRDVDPGLRQRRAMQVIHDAGGAFGGDSWATRDGIRTAAGDARLAQAARDLPAKYVARQGDLRRLTELGERWRSSNPD